MMDDSEDSKKITRKKSDFYNGGRGYNYDIGEEDISDSSSSSSRSPADFCILREQASPSSLTCRNLPTTSLFPGSPTSSYPLPPTYAINVSNFHGNHPYLTRSPYGTTLPYPTSESLYLQGAHCDPRLSHALGESASRVASYSAAHAAHFAQSCASSVGFVDQAWKFGQKNDSGNEHCHDSRSSTRQQKCSLCFNHGLIKEKKGHKWECQFSNCPCERCFITKGRQKTMRDQQKLTRHLQKMQL